MNSKLTTLLILGVSLIGTIAFLIFHKDIERPLTQNDIPFVATSTAAANAVILQPGQKLFKDVGYGYEFAYPENFKVTQYKEKDNGMTITFEDPAGIQDFQIFIIPYSTQITAARIKLDAHQVEGTPQEVVFGNTHALIFFSNQPQFGKLREVWFTNSGRLYEVTTAATNDTWIAGLMNTWRFGAGSSI
ncbi:MAG: hypothetical protein JWL82_215 [Parcubacteria group bacterium]|nr:hypothetical protein [Parcubacteria group bacterium]